MVSPLLINQKIKLSPFRLRLSLEKFSARVGLYIYLFVSKMYGTTEILFCNM